MSVAVDRSAVLLRKRLETKVLVVVVVVVIMMMIIIISITTTAIIAITKIIITVMWWPLRFQFELGCPRACCFTGHVLFFSFWKFSSSDRLSCRVSSRCRVTFRV